MKKIDSRLKSVLKECDLLLAEDKLAAPSQEQFQQFIAKMSEQYESLIGSKDAATTELERLKVILDTTPCTISWLDKEFNYVGVNKALAEMCSMVPEDFVGNQIGFHTDNKYYYNFAKRLFDSPEETLYDEITSEIAGEEKKFWIAGTKFHQSSQAVLIGVDMTDLKNLEAHVSFNEKLSALGEMVAGIMHEVNNPLSVIKLAASALKRKIDEPTEIVTKQIDNIERMSERINKIIRGVKNFVHRGGEEKREEECIRNIFEDVFTVCAHKVEKNHIDVNMDSVPENLVLSVNVTQIFQVLVNLINNSIDAIAELEEKWLKIEVEQDADYAYIYVTDSGNGIPKDIQEKIFNSFFTTKDLGKGTGLGLSLCRKIMVAHGGDIFIDDECPNTKFVVKLPLHAQPARLAA